LTSTTGGVMSWMSAGSSPALTATNVGYGNASNVLTGTSDFTWTESTKTLNLNSQFLFLSDPGGYVYTSIGPNGASGPLVGRTNGTFKFWSNGDA
jgi:hypothetical protein